MIKRCLRTNAAVCVVVVVLATVGGTDSGVNAGTTFVVNTVADGVDSAPGDGLCETAFPGECSLRAAIQESNLQPTPSTVLVPSGVYLLTLAGADEDSGASGDLDVHASVAIVGSSPATTIIDGVHADRVLDVREEISGPPVVAVVSGLTVQHGGNVFAGGGVANDRASLYLDRVVLRENVAVAGGAIFAEHGSTTVTDSTITGNSAETGGGIFSENQTLQMINSLVTSNTSASSGGGLVHNNGAPETTLTISRSVFHMNVSLNAYGGAVLHRGNGLITKSTFHDNYADTGGGGVFNQAGSGEDVLEFVHTDFVGNESPSGFGGALGSENGGTVVISRSEFAENSAWRGGAIWSGSALILSQSALIQNRATNGGGLWVTPISSGAVLRNSTVSGNQATEDGGGILVEEGHTTLENVTVTANISDFDDDGTGNGGGIHQGLGSTFDVSNSIISANADPGGEAPDCAGTLESGGYNILTTVDGCQVTGDPTGTLIGVSAHLQPLADNGGATRTHGLEASSPARDGGNPAQPGSGASACLSTDQRGVTRPQGASCDIGSLEATSCFDIDCDGVQDASDNCPSVANPNQLNSDGNYVDQSPPYTAAVDDKTLAYSDELGDACDSDDDNDGLSDVAELATSPCASASGTTDPADDDTDGDGTGDGAECVLGYDPASTSSTPPADLCGLATDSDGDRLADKLETCGLGTDPTRSDTDGDASSSGARDGCEVASINGDRVVNSSDQLLLAKELIRVMGGGALIRNIDLNRDGSINSGDQLLMALLIVPKGQCP